ncbi:hypothetical protein HDC94_000116 [Leifsonia sp. AK011]|uniref:alginate O-acetyltransferase AlgX-related protein n=1 Tax=Leifsonia sp. AK011 TaxID=2723075 RepID=UPI0015C9BAF0|nr:hypothetical protein [Leifsonia sp. AK011]NYF08960.1 hypothetical protein [Leifsonia sp. AK011]
MSLRELPPGQSNLSRWRHVRYVPLVILVILSLIAGVGGFIVGRVNAGPAPIASPDPDVSDYLLPDECHPATEVTDARPWSGGEAAASAAVWNAHEAEVGAPVIEGQDGWVFWSDIQSENMSQAVGRRLLSNTELGRWTKYLTETQEALAAEGIEFYLVVAPAKWEIYTDELPTWMQDVRGPGPLDQLLGVGADLPIIDVRQPLREASAEYQTYSRLNSHWSDYGSMVGWNAIAACLNANDSSVGTLSAFEPSSVENTVFNEFESYGFASESPDWTVPRFDTPLLEVERTLVDEEPEVVPGDSMLDSSKTPATTSTPGAQSDSSVLMIGDSFTTLMSVWVQQSFENATFVRHNFDAADTSTQPDVVALAKESGSNIVILEVTQRFLTHPPA